MKIFTNIIKCFVTVFVVFIFLPPIYLQKKHDYSIKIDSSFNELKFMWVIKDFLGYEKKVPREKAEWIYKLTALVDSYKNHLSKVTLSNRVNTGAKISTTKGEVFYFMNGKVLPEEDISNEDQYRSYFYPYKLGLNYQNFQREGKKDFPATLNYSFLNSLYGEPSIEIENELEIFRVLGRKIRFHHAQSASERLKAVFKEIQLAASDNNEIKKWIKGIRSISTYSNRTIQNRQRPSLHSYGIAVDILPRDRSKVIYWEWVEDFREDWWNVTEEQKAKVPAQVIDIFEKNGFVWGGKWYFFDIMHFEYRPELIKYAQLLKDDPLN